ncbi:MAG: squalene/phytoene synthase family protein [Pseudomonadota bacterium]
MAAVTETDAAPAAALVRAQDEALFATALFAPEPGRARLLTLYAFDVELSRAALPARRGDTGPMIALMRLQFWRDTVEDAFAGAPPRAHEIAAPLHALIASGGLAREAIEALLDAYEREITSAAELEVAFDAWAEQRFGVLVGLAGQALGAETQAVAVLAGQALARAFVLRNAGAMMAAGATVPGLGRRALLSERTAAEAVPAFAQAGLDALANARAQRKALARKATPALLPLWRAEHDLHAALAAPKRVGDGLPTPPKIARALGLGWRTLSGRW